MGKIILEFDSVQEPHEAKAAMDGMKWKIAMWDLDQELRSTTKYEKSVLGDNPAEDLEIQIAEKYREKILEILHEHGLSLHDD